MGRAKPKAEINFLRLSRSCVASNSEGGVETAAEPGQSWKRIEAYACRMRELLDEIKRGDCRDVDEYERMLAAAAAVAENQRRICERERAKAIHDKDSIARGQVADSSLNVGQLSEISSYKALASLYNSKAQPFAPNPSLAMCLAESGADKRAQLLGTGEGSVGARGAVGRGRGGTTQLNVALAEDKVMHERLEAELANMTKALKSNVEAMHATLVEDNAKLDQIDTDIVRGQHRLTKVNVSVDEQRAANRRTTCFQCIAVLLVTMLFFITFFLMKMFGKVPLRPIVTTPVITPFGGQFNGKVTVNIACSTKGASVHYTLDGSRPTKHSMVYDSKKKLELHDGAVGEGRAKSVSIRLSALARHPKMDDSDLVTATFHMHPPYQPPPPPPPAKAKKVEKNQPPPPPPPPPAKVQTPPPPPPPAAMMQTSPPPPAAAAAAKVETPPPPPQVRSGPPPLHVPTPPPPAPVQETTPREGQQLRDGAGENPLIFPADRLEKIQEAMAQKRGYDRSTGAAVGLPPQTAEEESKQATPREADVGDEGISAEREQPEGPVNAPPEPRSQPSPPASEGQDGPGKNPLNFPADRLERIQEAVAQKCGYDRSTGIAVGLPATDDAVTQEPSLENPEAVCRDKSRKGTQDGDEGDVPPEEGEGDRREDVRENSPQGPADGEQEGGARHSEL